MESIERGFESSARASWSRREVLAGALAVGGSALAAGPLLRAAGGPAQHGQQVLVYLFLRGGLDGLSLCVPYGDAALYAARPTLAVPPPGALGGALDLDGFFGLNPAAAPLLAPFHAGDLAFVHAFGSPEPTRSHFLAFHKVEFGIPNQPLAAASEGFIARHLKALAAAPGVPLRCAVLDEVMPQSLAGGPKTLPVSDPTALGFPGAQATAAAREALLRALYDGVLPPLGAAAEDTLDTLDLLSKLSFPPPENGAVYPDTPLGERLRHAAALIKVDVGVEAIMLDEDGYDHHSKQGPLDGELALMLDDLARGLAAFRLDLAGHWQRVTLVAHSEFGRRVAENASAGTDHGRGGIALVLGGHVAGGRVYGAWPSLAPAALDDGDLAVTTDYRDVLGEILAKRLGATDLGYVFPNHSVTFPGIVS